MKEAQHKYLMFMGIILQIVLVYPIFYSYGDLLSEKFSIQIQLENITKKMLMQLSQVLQKESEEHMHND